LRCLPWARHYRTFVGYNVGGGALWGTGVTVLGYFLGQIAVVRANIELILVGIVALSVLPIAIELVRSRRRPDHASRT
jgi:membrane-associated protein